MWGKDNDNETKQESEDELSDLFAKIHHLEDITFVVLLKGQTHNIRIKLGEITIFKNETSTTSWSDLPVVVVISGARNKKLAER